MKKIFILLLLAIAGCSSHEPRIISQSPYITHTLKYLCQEENIVGVSRYDLLDRPRTGGILDPEKEAIAGLEPDYIFTSDWTAPAILHEVTPEGAKAVVLQGFHEMEEIEDNIRVIAKILGLPEGERKADEFAAAWKRNAKEVKGEGRKALLLSSCKGEPFSFGRNTYLYDLFSVAGFSLVEKHPSIRHVNKSGDISSVDELLRITEPDIVFVLQDNEHGCSVDMSEGDYKVVLLNGEHFVYPAPVLMDGIADLKRIFPVPEK
ncbi:MAG: ABC transporter substrate-binding protein [Chlorobiales bacterium]|nr:ABC transporter substrate-binding protein [Chlorobiales bacterium]